MKNEKIRPNLVNEINKKLEENADLSLKTQYTDIKQESDLEAIDPETLMKRDPNVSIAQTLFLLERHLAAFIYLKTCEIDTGITFNREHLYSVYTGENVADVVSAEEKRLYELKLKKDEKELKEQKADVKK